MIKHEEVRVVIGAGVYNNNPGWVHTQEEELGLLDKKQWIEQFNSNSVTAILAEHVWEHLTYEEGIEATIPFGYIVKVARYRAVQPRGTAIFKHDKMVGYIDEKDTKSFLLLKGEAKSSLYIIENVLDTNNKLTIELMNNNVKIKPYMKDEELSVKINIEIEGTVGETVGNIDVSKEEYVKKLEEYSEKVIKRDFEEFIKKIQNEYKSDILGIGKFIHNREPQIWRDIGENWENVFPYINIEIDVKVNINGTGLILKPVIKKGK